MPQPANPDEFHAAKRRSVSHNAILNLVGSIIPMFVMLATVPPFLRLIGDVRFGILAIVWLFLSYFGLFEMGLGRATSKYIAELKDGPPSVREALFWTAAVVNLAVGVVGGLLLWAGASAALPLWMKGDPSLQMEVARAMPWLAVAVPVATLTSVLIGALEGREQFGVINVQQIVASVMFQTVPLAAAYWIGPRVDIVVPATILARVAANLPLLLSCARHVPLQRLPRVDRDWLRRLFSYGLWVTVSGIVGPLLSSLDRFVIGLAQGAQAVTYYAIPYNFATKLWVLPGSLARALFPRFSAQAIGEAKAMSERAVLVLAAGLTPMVVVAILLTGPFFRLWIGVPAAARCTVAGEIMLIGVWINSLGYIPYGLLQAQGRPDLTAKFHLLELLPFVLLLWAGTHFAGVVGAATVWGVRVTVDAVLLFAATGTLRAVAGRLVPSTILIALAFGFSVAAGDRLVPQLLLALMLGIVSLIVAHATSPEVAGLLMSQIRARLARGEVSEMPRIGE